MKLQFINRKGDQIRGRIHFWVRNSEGTRVRLDNWVFSHGAYLGRASIPWLTTVWILSQFAKQKKLAVNLYEDFVLKSKGEKHLKEFHHGNVEGRILGEDRFAEDAFAKASQKVKHKITLEQMK